MLVVGKCNAQRGHFEVNVGAGRRRRRVERGGDGSRQCLGSSQTLHVHAVDVQHVASCTTYTTTLYNTLQLQQEHSQSAHLCQC